MEELDLPAITEWLNLDNNRAYKLFRRKDGTIIAQIRRDEDRRIYIQVDLDYAIRKSEED